MFFYSTKSIFAEYLVTKYTAKIIQMQIYARFAAFFFKILVKLSIKVKQILNEKF
jgi:hypothetical protein